MKLPLSTTTHSGKNIDKLPNAIYYLLFTFLTTISCIRLFVKISASVCNLGTFSAVFGDDSAFTYLCTLSMKPLQL